MGKSALALGIARNVSVKDGMTAALFSLEMSRGEIAMRLCSAECRVPCTTSVPARSARATSREWPGTHPPSRWRR